MAQASRPVRRVVPVLDAAFHFGRGIAEGVLAYSRAAGNWAVATRLNERPVGRDLVDLARSTRADGLIVALPGQAIDIDVGCPLVNVADGPWVDRLPSVYTDNHAAGRLAAEHLMERGYRRFVGFMPLDKPSSTKRFKAFSEAIAGAGLACERVAQTLSRDQMAQWLNEHPEPYGVLGFGERGTADLADVAWSIGRAVPETLGIVVVGSDPLIVESGHVRLTTVVPPLHEIGYEASKLLDHLMDGGAGSAGDARLSRSIEPKGVVVRDSTDAWVTADAKVRRALELIRQNVDDPPLIEQIADEVGLSPRQLQQRFTHAIGQPVGRVMVRARLDRARRLLATTDQPLGEIAAACGFKSTSFFCKAFRDHSDQTPIEYRKRLGRGR